MRIYLGESNNLKFVRDYLVFNEIPFDSMPMWDADLQQPRIIKSPDDPEPCCLVCTYQEFDSITSVDGGLDALAEFLQKSRMIVTQDIDSFISITYPHLNRKLFELDCDPIPENHLQLILDAPALRHSGLIDFAYIKVITQQYNWFMRAPRIKDSHLGKYPDSKDFLLTTVKKDPPRVHREELWHQLTQQPELMARGHAYYKPESDQWIGHENKYHVWKWGFPSMDLYRHSWCEVVPETLYQHGHYFTEKTIKPMITKTPFFVVSTPGYLSYLRNMGFQTFESIIDESYDHYPDIKDRVAHMLEQLKYVIDQGITKFYSAAGPILDHNYCRILEITGNHQHQYDIMIKTLLDRAVDQ